jgi:hypothetical protein
MAKLRKSVFLLKKPQYKCSYGRAATRVVSKCIFIYILLLRLCRNCLCTCGFAAQKHIFAAVPQDKKKDAL